MALAACLGVAGGGSGGAAPAPSPSDECSDSPGGGAAEWFPHVIEDQDVQPVGRASSSASWGAAEQLMSQRVFALAIGGGFYYGGANGNSRLPVAVFRGELQALAVYRRRLAPAERTATQRWLADRYYLQCVIDAMAIVRSAGRPAW